MIDGYHGDPNKLADINLLYTTLNELPATINMHKVGFPQIIQFTEAPIAGLSGFIFIVESHISIHTYSQQGFLSMDVYSCEYFDYKKIIRQIRQIYGIKRLDKHLVTRGKYFHPHISSRPIAP